MAVNRKLAEKNLMSLFDLCEPNSGEIIEISGTKCMGKSHIIHSSMAKNLLPTEFNGNNKGVLILDADCGFNIQQFVRILLKRLKLDEAHSNLSPEKRDPVIQSSLQKLFIVPAINFDAFNIILDQIHIILRKYPIISMIVIDSINHFFTNFLSNDPDFFHHNHLYLQEQMKTLKALACSYKCILMYTKITDFEPYMYLNFNNSIEYKITLISINDVCYAKIKYLRPLLEEYKIVSINENGFFEKFSNCSSEIVEMVKKYLNESHIAKKIKQENI